MSFTSKAIILDSYGFPIQGSNVFLDTMGRSSVLKDLLAIDLHCTLPQALDTVRLRGDAAHAAGKPCCTFCVFEVDLVGVAGLPDSNNMYVRP